MPKLYDELAEWWPLLSDPDEYADEAAFARQLLHDAGLAHGATLLELGSGGGNNAHHLKAHFRMTLSDLSPGMLAVSRGLNPECEHIEGDMRTLRLGRGFDGVFVHDAIMYMTTLDDLRRAMETAYVHCRPDGAALFVPDHVSETFQPYTKHGGHDSGDRGLRYLEWVHPAEPDGTTVATDFAYVLRQGNTTTVEHDRHSTGLFPRADWLRLLEAAGFDARIVPDSYHRELFVALKRHANGR